MYGIVWVVDWFTSVSVYTILYVHSVCALVRINVNLCVVLYSIVEPSTETPRTSSIQTRNPSGSPSATPATDQGTPSTVKRTTTVPTESPIRGATGCPPVVGVACKCCLAGA